MSWLPDAAAELDLKVPYLTGFADLLFKQQGSAWDGEAYLEKPCTINGLIERSHPAVRSGPGRVRLAKRPVQ